MKRGLLSMAVLALSLVGASPVSAQSWVGSAPAAGTFYLYNVGVGQWYCGGNAWGTHASLGQLPEVDVILTPSGSGYSIDTQISNGGNNHYLNGEWSDGSAQPWTFTAGAQGYIINNGAGNLAYSGNGTNLTVDASITSFDAQWLLVSKDELLASLNAATPTNPVDATFLIKDPSFGRNDTRSSAWKCERSGGNFTLNGPNANRGSFGCELWNNTFDFYQDITGFPEGTYELTVDGYGTNGTTYMYINDSEAAFVNTASAANFSAALDEIAAGQHTGNTTGKVNVSSTTMRIGLKRTSQVGFDWTVFDNFRLKYYGFDMNALVTSYQTTLDKAQTMNGVMSAQARTGLDNALGSYSNPDLTNKDEVKAALNGLNAAIAIATQSIADYQTIAAELEKYRTAPGAGTLASKYENRSFTDLADFYSQLRSVITSNLGSQDGVDITAVILNPCPTSNLNYWTGNESNAYDPANNVAEYWNMSGAKFEQTIPQLPEGTYFLTVKAFCRTGMSSTLSVSGGAAASINLVTVGNDVCNNRGDANNWFNAGNGDNVLAFNIVGAPKDVTITLTADAANGDHWTVWRNFTLEYNTLKDLVFNNFGTTTIKLADGTVINNGDTKSANANQIKDGILISFPGNDVKNVNIHPSHYQAFGKIENKTDGVTYFVRSNGYFDNGYNPDFTIKFGQGLFGWSDNSLSDYIAAVGSEISKRKTYEVTIDKVVFINQQMDAVDMTKGYEVNVMPMPFLWGSYAVPDTKDMTAEDYILPNGNQYIYEMFTEAYIAKHGTRPMLPEQDVDYYLELKRYHDGWQAGDAYIDPATMQSTYPTTNPYRALTADEEEYIRFFLATYCEGVIMEKDANVPYVFTIRTAADVKQDVDKIERDQKVTAWDVKGNQVTDLLFQPSIQTSIEGIQAATEDGAIYNLAGQRVQTARKGIYIVNGKKVVLK